MVNSNPETVSTDFDISDKLYFEPLTLEDVLEIVQREQPIGVIVQLGGQTPLKLARGARGGRACRSSAPRPTRSTSRRTAAGSRRSRASSGVAQPPSGTATSRRGGASRWPSGSAIRCWCGRPTCWAGARWRSSTTTPSLAELLRARRRACAPEHPVLIDRFLEDAFEADVDAICRRRRACVIGGVMQHIEDAGIHSGDSACVLPPYLIAEAQVDEMREHTSAFAEALGVVGLSTCSTRSRTAWCTCSR